MDMKRFKYIFVAFALLISSQADAASRFWVPLTVTNAVAGTGGLCRLTVNDTTNLTAGTPIIVAGITGATTCNGTTTVTTVVSSTLVEINDTFGVAYVSGGTVAGGKWTAAGTGNWSATTGGTGGQTVPGSADAVTFDASSGGGTVTVNTTVNVTSITMGTFTGTLDFSANNNNVTVQTLSLTGTGVRTFNWGTGTYTITGTSGIVLDMSTVTNSTISSSSANIVFTATTSSNRLFTNNGPTQTFGSLTINGNTSGGLFTLNNTPLTIGTLTINGPNYVQMFASSTFTCTTFAIVGTSSAPVGLESSTLITSPTISVASNAPSMTWAAFRRINFSGGASFAAANSLDLGGNTGITITPPSTGGGSRIIGGWLLRRDLTPERHNNLPAFLDEAA